MDGLNMEYGMNGQKDLAIIRQIFPFHLSKKRIINYIEALLLLILTGCQVTRFEPSNIHPYKDKPYQEVGVDLSGYKSVQTRTGQDPNIALAVAISGGGHRAANFGAGVMLGLENLSSGQRKNALKEVDYFSTVSGGGYAVSTYISSLHDYLYFCDTPEGYSYTQALDSGFPAEKCPCSECPDEHRRYDPCLRRHLQGFYDNFFGDFLKDLFALLTLDLFEKGGHYETTIGKELLGQQFRQLKLASDPNLAQDSDLTLGDIFIRKDDCTRTIKLPFWIPNATAYENGAMFIFTPDHLMLYEICGYRHFYEDYLFDKSKQNYNEFIDTIPLSVGVTASANFPVATYPTTLMSRMDPNNPYLHLFDGGLSDNLAVITAVRTLTEENSPYVHNKVLIVADAYKGKIAPFSSIAHPPAAGKTAVRAMDISLDSWRGRYREVIEIMCRQKKISVVFLTFEDLSDIESLEVLKPYGLEDEDIQELMSDPEKPAQPFEMLRSISTLKIEGKGALDKSEQNLLLAAGKYAVNQKKQRLLNSLNW